MRYVKKVLFILFLLLSLAYLFILVTPRIFKNFYPFGIKTAVVLTGSMEPTISINDFVILKKPTSVNVNDVVSFVDPKSNKEVLHRVISIHGNLITTKGDANNTIDKPIHISQITGVYVGKLKFLGSFISIITDPRIFGVIVAVLVFILIFPSRKRRLIVKRFKVKKLKR